MKRTVRIIVALTLCAVMAFFPLSGTFAASKKYQS